MLLGNALHRARGRRRVVRSREDVGEHSVPFLALHGAVPTTALPFACDQRSACGAFVW
jgi:hypothetical protein